MAERRTRRYARWGCLALTMASLSLGFVSTPARAIVGGGQERHPERFGFMASWNVDGNFACGATVISPTWVLTAGHCVFDGKPASAYEVVTVWNGKPGASISRHKVVEIFRHPDYRTTPSAVLDKLSEVGVWFAGDPREIIYRDVAVARLATPSSVRPIALPDESDNGTERAGTSVHVIGWGGMDPLGVVSIGGLRNTTVQVVGDAECFRFFRNPGAAALVSVCAGQLGRDSCYGDSGGPLFTRRSDRFLQIGIVSTGPSLCATPKQPGIYAEVNEPSTRRFIRAKTGV